MKRVLVLALFALSGVAHAAMDPNLIGAWKSDAAVFGNPMMSVYLGMNFKADSTADMSAICQYSDGKVLESVVTVPVNVENGAVNVLGSGHAENKDGGYACSVDMQAGSVPYSLNNGKVTLVAPGAPPLTFSRR